MRFCPSWANGSDGLRGRFSGPSPYFTLQHPFHTRLKGPAGPAIVSLALAASFIFVPLLGSFTVFILPAPLAYLYLKHGPSSSAVTSLMVIGLAVIWGFPVFTMMFFGLCICGLALGIAAEKKFPDDKAVLWGTLGPIIAVLPLAGAYLLLIGVNPIQHLDSVMNQGVAQSVGVYKQMGVSQAEIDALTPSLKTVARLIENYFPAITFASVAATSFSAWVILKIYARRGGISFAEWDFSKWRLPDHLVWGVIVPGFLLIPDMPVLRIISGNILVIFAMPYLFLGIALLVHLFDKYKLSPFLRALIYIVIAIQPILAALVWAAGFFDTWADFRKIGKKA